MEPGDDLFFIRSELPDHPISKGFRWSLYVVNVRSAGLKAYVAFRSITAARLIAHQSPMLSVVAAKDVDSLYSCDFGTTAVMLFDSIGEVMKFIQDRRAYPLDEHLYMYSRDEGLAKIG